jgi:hypothetical protein
MLTLETRNTITGRAIDFQFHKFYWENRWTSSTENHINHQYTMLEAIRGHEVEIFTDVVHYPFRDHFNGSTGTLSNLLANCFFHIYLEMLKQGIPVNAEADLKTLYCLVYRFNNKISPIELYFVKQIRDILCKKAPFLPFLTSSYYAIYYELIERADRELLLPSSTCTFYKENPNERSIDFLKGRAPYSIEFSAIKEPFQWMYGPCEYGPDYLDMKLFEPICGSRERLRQVEHFFMRSAPTVVH